MDGECANSCRNPPERDADRLDFDARLTQERGHQHDRAESHEDIFAEEQADVIGRCGIRSQLVANLLRQCPKTGFGSTFCHWCEQRSHHLWMAAQAGKTDGCGHLACAKVDNQQAARSRGLDAADPSLGVLAQTITLEQANHRQR